MQFVELPLKGAFVITPPLVEDQRGSFGRSFCEREFADHGIAVRMVQSNISFNRKKNTLRGMHYQAQPKPEAKLVRCTRGSIYDVIIDLRRNSSTFCKWVGTEINEDNHLMVFVPEIFAHGFITLEDDTEVFYQMSEFYHPKHARGVRWNDMAFRIDWPCDKPIISEKDATYTDFRP